MKSILALGILAGALGVGGWPAAGPGTDRPSAPALQNNHARPADSGQPHAVSVMDPEGAAIGDRLSDLEGTEFEAAYEEHARHIVMAQERARRLSEGKER